MKFVLFLIVLALVPCAWAQDASTAGVVEITSVDVSAQSGEVRLEIHTSAPPPSPGSVVKYTDSLILNLPGVIYKESAHRFVINQAGVRDVRIWLQNPEPALTRISVELSQSLPYLLSSDANGLLLRIGSGVQGADQTLSSKNAKRRPAAAAAGRPSGPARAADRIAGVFRRPEKQPEIVRPNQAPPNPSVATSQTRLPPLVPAPQTSEPNAPVASVPAPPAATQPAASAQPPAQPPVETMTGTSNSGTANVAVAPNPPAEPNPSVTFPAAAQPPAAAESSPVVPSSTAETVPTANSETSSASVPGSVPAEVTPSFPSAEPKIGGQPVTSQDVAVAQTFAEVPNANLRTLFHVKFVQQDTAYIDGGRSAGLSEGMKLVVKDAPSASGSGTDSSASDAVEAELVVVGVAETSAVTEIHQPKRSIVPGDVAYLSNEDTQALVQQHALGTTRKYPAVISFTEGGDALDQEAHAEVPRPPLPSVNHARGRIGFDYMGTQSLDSSHFASRDLGMMVQADFTRIGGTYWNLNGFWRGQLNSSSSAGQFQTLQDLINRTYHLGFTYDNPNGNWVAGFGRLYLPWASSLDTIDGGYFGRRVRQGIIVGMFAGSTPDPTSWNYNPNLRLGGVFVNFEGGSFESFHYSSTSGAGVSMLVWQVDRPFVFFENSISYKRNFSIYHALQADSPAGNPAVAAPGPGIGRSFLTVRWSPIPRLQLDANHTYFRDVPTFDPTLVGTGLLDKYLFQGFSGGAHVDIVKQIAVYTELGRSNRTGDSQSSLNQMYGVTFGRVPFFDVRADVHYSRFNSSFGGGTYEALTLSKSFTDRFRLDVLVGNQAFNSTLAGNQTAHFVTTTVDSSLGAKLFLESGLTVFRGQLQSYNQWIFTFGYRFDSKARRQ